MTQKACPALKCVKQKTVRDRNGVFLGPQQSEIALKSGKVAPSPHHYYTIGGGSAKKLEIGTSFE
jgi:hypothetical protein